MDFDLSDEQVMLRDTVRGALTRAYDIETLRQVTDTPLGWSKQVWTSLAEIGILGLVFAEEYGGMGAGPEELSAVMGEFGAALAPEPFLDSVVVPGLLVERSTAEDTTKAEFLGPLAEGQRLAAFAHLEAGDRWPSSTVASTVTGGRLTGTKPLVPHGDCADVFVVSARDETGTVGLYLVDADAEGVTRTGYRTHDRRRGAQVAFDGVAATRLGGGDASAVIAEVELVEQSALCAEAVGAMTKSLHMTVDYLKQRKQFGVPLASFQALTHRAADMYSDLELASSMSLYLTAALADGTADTVAGSRAKLQICRSGRHIGQEAIQMHGGIGVTAEYPIGHYVSRLTAISHTLGDADAHLAALSGRLRDWDMVTVG
ncbi:putative acyl-CoA dehydrogenase [Gordonia hirsuta DSM 44140 = NBRC 16056]|uniref:Putative acyl-CoA dehydrogenase n=1 Tax=Gordonia hirsuta DSM 44140 = NBRC 16056 TaxID=1121927 RepID=L7L787_9ACTN|nr:acyl-CoA dehydrogenase family protein [Gordonia hirsuta]GAC56985.1 putative acyl-CoA dehydrogenase [Gordonia hirsuta DSM 44140 = NBRC 16056]